MSKIKDYSAEYVEINGIMQYFLHYPSRHDGVAIMLHGGPGQSEAFLAHALRPYWDFCGVVCYDQRGAGKTQARNNSKPEDITIETLITDLKQTIQYIKEKYQTKKVILVGHSWGTVLGTQYVLKYPHDVICYIGYGQAIDALRGEKIAYDKLKNAIENKGAAKDMVKLRALGDYPYGVSPENIVKSSIAFRKLQAKYGFAGGQLKAIKAAIKSPVITLGDIFASDAAALKLNKNVVDTFLTYSVWNTTEYQLPIYYVLGTDDWQTPSVLAAEYFERITAPRKGLYWVENAGHLTDIDNPEEFCQALREIITSELQAQGRIV